MELMITAIAGFSILLGALATHLIKDTEKMEHLSMALALGALAALLLFDLFPEVHELVEAQGWGYSLGMLVVGIAMFYVWPVVQQGIALLGNLVVNSGFVGTWIYGITERALIPFGLHPVFYMPFWQTAMGGTAIIRGRDAEHIRVLRMKPGEDVIICDGADKRQSEYSAVGVAAQVQVYPEFGELFKILRMR